MATVFGARKGLAWQVASISSIVASYFIAYQFREPVAAAIKAAPPWNTFLAMLIVYLSASAAIWLVFRFVSEFIDRVRLREFDHHAGAALGFCRGILWCAIITLFAVTLLGESQRQKIVQSKSGHYIAALLDRSEAIMPAELQEVLSTLLAHLGRTSGAKIQPHPPAGNWGPPRRLGATICSSVCQRPESSIRTATRARIPAAKRAVRPTTPWPAGCGNSRTRNGPSSGTGRSPANPAEGSNSGEIRGGSGLRLSLGKPYP